MSNETPEYTYGVKEEQFRGEENLFTKITQSMRTATERRTYQPYFQALQQTKQGSFMSALSGKLGTTQSGKSLGFAGVGQESLYKVTLKWVMQMKSWALKRVYKTNRKEHQVLLMML